MKKALVGIMMISIMITFISCNKGADNIKTDKITQNASSSIIKETTEQTELTSSAKCLSCGNTCEIGMSYCSSCKCIVSDCNIAKKDMSSYCVNHSCLICGSERGYLSSYCLSHQCLDCGNVVVEGSRYCVTHKCLLCNNRVSGSSQYCFSHS